VMGPTARIDDNAGAIVESLVAEATALSAEVGVVEPVGPNGGGARDG
jgi:hypothetical protein